MRAHLLFRPALAPLVLVLVCQCGGTATSNRGTDSAGRGGAAATVSGEAAGAESRSTDGAGVVLGASGAPGGSTGENSSGDEAGAGGAPGTAACPVFDECTFVMGGRGNVCGGVVADARFLVGTGFEQFDGLRVVTPSGHATIEDGAFSVYEGTYAGCGERLAQYRIDVTPNGRCDDDDLAFQVEGTGPDLRVDGNLPGSAIACNQLGDGYDLEVTLAPSCLPRCGAMRVTLLDETDAPLLPADTIFLDMLPYEGHGVAATLVPGASYSLRYAWGCGGYWYTGCTGATEYVWSRRFTAVEGVNRIELSAAEAQAGAPP